MRDKEIFERAVFMFLGFASSYACLNLLGAKWTILIFGLILLLWGSVIYIHNRKGEK